MSAAETVQKYFNFFNTGDRAGMFSLLNEDIIHDINQGESRRGLNLFKQFMQHMDECYKEELKDIVVMTSASNAHRASAEFTVHGTYLKTDKGLPAAKNQKYIVPAGSFFELKDGKISRVTTYYNLPQWIKAVQ